MSDTPTDTDTAEARAAEAAGHDRFDADSMKWLSGIVSLVGLLLAVSPFVWAVSEAAIGNNIVVGLAVFLLAGYNYYRMSKGYIGSISVAALVALLGLWTIIAPFLYPFDAEVLAWTTVAAGIVIALVSGYNAYESRQAAAATTASTRA